jgi:ribosomal protein S1
MIRIPKWFLGLLVVVLVLGLAGVAMGEEVTGKVKAIDSGGITVTVKYKDMTFRADKAARAEIIAALAKIKAGDEVTVTYKDEGKALKIEPKK